MKEILLLLFIILNGKLFSQNQVRPFIGINVTNTRFHHLDKISNIDSTGLRLRNAYLPIFGTDINFDVMKNINLTTGLAVSFMGSNKYNRNIPQGLNIDPHLRLGYIRLPLNLNIEIINGIKILVGYSLNYNFRKNLNLNIMDENTFEEIETYQPFYHTGILGISKDWEKWRLTINYNKGLSRIFDTKNASNAYQIYLTMSGIQIAFGYIIKE